VRHEERARKDAAWRARQAQRERDEQERSREWWARYNAYLATPGWAERRRLVIERCVGICEGCRLQRVTQVHHLTYENVCAEFLWELVGVCDECHERYHAAEEARRAQQRAEAEALRARSGGR
jgi:hypothetical protein